MRRCAGRTCCGIRWPPVCSTAAPACARSPTCSGTGRWPPPGSTPRSTSRRCARSRCRGREATGVMTAAGRSPRWSRTTSRCAVAWATARRCRSARCGPSPDTWTRPGIEGPIPLEASLDWATSTTSTDPVQPGPPVGDGARLSASPVRARRRPPRCPRRDCSARPATAHRRTCTPTGEIADLLQAAAGLAPAGGLRPHCYATLFGLIACTGLRIGEALALTCDDVDLTEGVLTVRAGKRGRTRLVPLHPSALAPLRDYAADRARRYGPPRDGCGVLPHRPQRPDQLQRRQPRLQRCCAASWAGPRPAAPARHGCTTCATGWWCAASRPGTPQGVDVDAKIPVLATYLGHVEVRDALLVPVRGPRADEHRRRPVRSLRRPRTRQVRHESAADRVPAAGAGLLPAPPDRPARRQRPHRRGLPRRVRAAARLRRATHRQASLARCS